MRKIATARQHQVFGLLYACGELVLACGSNGAVANLVGQFQIRRNNKGEDQLDVGDGTHHVHLDWSRVSRFEAGSYNGEGTLKFFDAMKILFTLYRTIGLFPSTIELLAGDLIVAEGADTNQ